MRVLNVMLGDGLGGLEHASVQYAELLQRMGHEVICVLRKGAKAEAVLAARFPVRVMASGSEYDPRSLWHAHRILANDRPDMIVVHGRRALKITAMVKRYFGHHQPLVAVLHGPRFKHLHYADHVITVSRALREQAIIADISAERVTHVPNFLLEAPPEIDAPPPFRNPPVIGVLARLAPVKGIDLLLEALVLLKQRGVAFRAVIAGAGGEERALRAQAVQGGVGEEVQWLGWVEDTRRFYEQIDIFCSPSREEAFGLSLLHAMDQAKAIVATATPGSRELIEDRRTGFLCEISPPAIAEALEQMIRNPEMAALMAKQAHVAAAAYHAEAIAPQLDQCLMHVLGTQSRATSGVVFAQH